MKQLTGSEARDIHKVQQKLQENEKDIKKHNIYVFKFAALLLFFVGIRGVVVQQDWAADDAFGGLGVAFDFASFWLQWVIGFFLALNITGWFASLLLYAVYKKRLDELTNED